MTNHKKPSVLSRFRLAGVSVIVGVSLAGVLFYGMLSRKYLTRIISRTMGPYSDALASHIFANPDPEAWRRIAKKHRVAILIKKPSGDLTAFGPRGESLPATDLDGRHNQIIAVREAADGTQVTLFWNLGSIWTGHLSLLAGLLVMFVAVVGSAFWFLQRQLKPLSRLHTGVEAVARGDFKARVPVVRDDEIGQIAGAFNVMASQVGEMINDRERLLADVSHELRSPIARMKVALEFMPPGNKREALARDLREMENLVTVLLEREELRSRVGPLTGRNVDLNALALEVTSLFANQGPGVELVSGATETVHADPALMKLLMQNLVENAVKFSLPDSQPVEMKLETASEHVTLRVVDDGVGIPDGCEEQVFEPLVKLDRARGHRVGYGIGLNLCKRVVELHGGTIRLLQRQPRGTEVVVTLNR